MKKTRHLPFSTTRKILLSFLLAIIVGSILLVLPISSATGVTLKAEEPIK